MMADSRWHEAWSALPPACPDVYFHPDYLALHARHDGASPVLSVQGPPALLISGARHPLPDGGGWDLQSVNGYGGPLAGDAGTADLARVWVGWRAEQAEAGGVAAFFRLHPLLDNGRWLPADARIQDDRQTVYVPVGAGLEAVWDQATSAHRNMVRKGQKAGLAVCWNRPEDWAEAATLYAEAMTRLHAPERLRFGSDVFAGLEAAPWAELAAVRTGALLAFAVVLTGPLWSHYHLAARRPEAGNHVGSLLLQAVIERTHALGLAGCHLGGGISAAPDDPLLRFKRSLGGRLLPFQVAGLILDPAAYHRRLDQWQARSGRSPRWFLGYREPIDAP